MNTSMTEVYLDAFRKFLKGGMTHLEAYQQFDEDKIREAMLASLGAEEGRELLDLMAAAGAEEADERDLEQAIELWLAGWTSEKPSEHCRVMSWYWRAPPKRANKPGRRYLSTNQAFNALKRSEKP